MKGTGGDLAATACIAPDEPGESGRESAALSSVAPLAGARVRAIEHSGECYYLRLTRNGKLILCK